jgi:hypothetical protein
VYLHGGTSLTDVDKMLAIRGKARKGELIEEMRSEKKLNGKAGRSSNGRNLRDDGDGIRACHFCHVKALFLKVFDIC